MRWRLWIVLAVVVLLVAAGAYSLLQMEQAGLGTRSRSGELASSRFSDQKQEEASTGEQESDDMEASTTQLDSAVRGKLKGRWLRPDGGYVLEIRDVAADGTMDAGYYNPQSIHVAEANATASEEGRVELYVELRDVGYPGSNYHLQYDADNDRLVGVYAQPAMGQQFEVTFVRQ